jgi:divalent metal cation (Fe/Co/Zn/Cd) transporter
VSQTAERRAQKAVAVSFWLLAPYVAVEAVHKLITREHPQPSLLGIVLTAASLVLMPVLGVAKQRLGRRLDSGATAGEGTQNLLCAYLAGAVLIGLALNTWAGWWWADPLIALAVAGVAVKEGIESWRGDGCDCATVAGLNHPSAQEAGCDCQPGCTDTCCQPDTAAR